MTLGKFIEGIQILRPHYKKKDRAFCLGAEHDVFYMYATDTPLSESEVARMRKLNWFQNVPLDADGEPGPYDPSEGWAAYT